MSYKEKRGIRVDYNLLLFFALLGLIYIVACVCGKRFPWDGNAYNSYVLQARAWLDGRLDLGQDYPYLELAIYQGKYFVSFPPVPGFIYVPLLVLGGIFCDNNFLALIVYFLNGYFVYKIFDYLWKVRSAKCEVTRGLKPENIVSALAFTVGTNLLFISTVSWVWFIAQTLAFMFTTSAIYSALKGRYIASSILIALAVGCRPFQILYYPLIMYLLFFKNSIGNAKLNAPCQRVRESPNLGFGFDELMHATEGSRREGHRRGRGDSFGGFFNFDKTSLLCFFIPSLIIAIIYMTLNYARFGNPLEFGHNYLPEFTRTKEGQFNLSYLKANLYSLIRLPEIIDGKLTFQNFDGFNMLIASPPLCFAFYIIAKEVKDVKTRTLTTPYGRMQRFVKSKSKIWGLTPKTIAITTPCGRMQRFVVAKSEIWRLTPVLIVLELLFICLHKTMGGSHYGNRYTIDTIPFFIFIVGLTYKPKKTTLTVLSVLTLLGIVLNCYWMYLYR